MLKRKNDDENELMQDTQKSKRLAMDSSAVEADEAQKLKNQTAPLLDSNLSKLLLDDASPSNPEVANFAPVAGAASSAAINAASIAVNDTNGTNSNAPQRISSHKVYDNDNTYVHFRMLVPVREAGLIVGKGGETINHIKEVSNARVNVSENIKGIDERVIHVKGPAEQVAKAFGLIIRAINDEPPEASGPNSRTYALKLLITHSVIGYVIGKGGSTFKEIERKSSASLKASDTILPFSTDRCLTITGVADAIHIAVYYVAEAIFNNKSNIPKVRPMFYNPGNSHLATANGNPLAFGTAGIGGMPQAMGGGAAGSPVNAVAAAAAAAAAQSNFQFNPAFSTQFNPQMMQMMQHQTPYINNNATNPKVMNGNNGMNPYSAQLGVLGFPESTINHIGTEANSFGEQGADASNGSSTGIKPVAPLPNSYSVPNTTLPSISQNIYVANQFIGSVIGKGGKNIKEVRNATGTQIKVQDPSESGPNDRKIIVTGGQTNIQMAIYLINNRIEFDRIKNQGKKQ